MKTKKGFILYLSLILLSLLLLMSLSLSQIVVFQSKILQTIGKSVIAYYAAETGVERGLYEYFVNNQNPPFSASSPVDSAQYSVIFHSPSPNPNDPCPQDVYKEICIISTGKFLDIQRTVSANY